MIDQANSFFLDLQKPQVFLPNDPENAVLKMELSYMTLSSMMAGNNIPNAGELPILTFYGHLHYIKKSNAKPPKN